MAVRFLFDLEHWTEIKAALLRNRLRTVLTAFGVFWGIFLLMIMLGSGSGIRNGVMREFSGVATNSFFLWSQRAQRPFAGLPAGRYMQMTTEDVAAIHERVPEVEIVAPRRQLWGAPSGNNVVRGTKSGAFTVMGDCPEIIRIQPYRIEAGRFLDPLDEKDARKVTVIGPRARAVLFEPSENPIGQSIVINGVYFQVVGVFASGRSGHNGDRDAQSIFVPFSVFERAFNWGNRVGWMALTSRADVPAARAEEAVLALMRQRHKVAPDDLRAFGHYNVAADFKKVVSLFAGISILVWIVGSGTLAAGAIGVSNIMLIIIKERTKEIGIRRAVGARPSAIAGQIIFESVVLTSTAGYLGLVAGIALVEGAGKFLPAGGGAQMFANPEVQLSQAWLALLILIASGVLAGLAPARRALQVNPIVALRSE